MWTKHYVYPKDICKTLKGIRKNWNNFVKLAGFQTSKKSSLIKRSKLSKLEYNYLCENVNLIVMHTLQK